MTERAGLCFSFRAQAWLQARCIALGAELTNRLMHTDLVILDELGYLPFSQAGGALLFHLISKLPV